MFSHANLGTNDLPRAIAFFDAVLAPLGIVRTETGPAFAAWRGSPDGPALYVGLPVNGAPATASNGATLAFRAPSRAAVRDFHRLALSLGAADEGPPGPRAYRPGYYGAYVRDPDGNKLHAVHQPARP